MGYKCPLGNQPTYKTCRECAKEHAGAGICGACEGVKKGLLEFTCKDCDHPDCRFSGAKEILSCIECYRDIHNESEGVWVDVDGEELLFCSEWCGKKFKTKRMNTPVQKGKG